jgi:hypothetical protein
VLEGDVGAARVEVLLHLRELGVLLLDLGLELVVEALDLVARPLELVLAALVLLEEAGVLDRDRAWSAKPCRSGRSFSLKRPVSKRLSM